MMKPPTQLPAGRYATSPTAVRALWAVYAAGVLTGTVILAGAVGPFVAAAPGVAAVAVLAFGAFAAFCVWLLSKIPYFGHVRRATMALAMAWGGLVAAGYGLMANRAIYDHFAADGDSQSWALFAPLTEEPWKNLGVVVVLLLVTPQPRTALDGLVVGSLVGLGFETVENVVQSLNNALAAQDEGIWGSLAVDVVHEVLRRSWTGHIVITGIAGFGIAYAMTNISGPRSGIRRWAVAVGLVLLAFGAHLLWNSPRFGVFYVVGQFSILAVYLWLIRVGRRQEARLYVPYLGYVTPGVVEPALAGALHSAKARRVYRKASGCSRQDQRAVARLAAAIGNGDSGPADAAARQLLPR